MDPLLVLSRLSWLANARFFFDFEGDKVLVGLLFPRTRFSLPVLFCNNSQCTDKRHVSKEAHDYHGNDMLSSQRI